MLGAELGQEVGRIIGQRIVDAEGPKIESTFSAEGTFRTIAVFEYEVNGIGNTSARNW